MSLAEKLLNLLQRITKLAASTDDQRNTVVCPLRRAQGLEEISGQSTQRSV